MQQVWGISRSLAAFHVNNLSTFIVTDVTLLLWVISPLTALKQCYAQCFESNHTRLLHTVCLSWLYYSTTTLCMHVCYVSRLISLSHRASLTSQLCLFVSPWVGGGSPNHIATLHGKRPWKKIHGHRHENLWGAERPTLWRMCAPYFHA